MKTEASPWTELPTAFRTATWSEGDEENAGQSGNTFGQYWC
jgi:hypothetical protein